MSVPASWRAALLRRLPPGRDDLGPAGLYERYWAPAGLPRARVLTILDLLELEYDLPVGLCRPEDRLGLLLEPVPTWNPLRWLADLVIGGNRQAEPPHQPDAPPLLLRARGARPAADPETLDDLVRAWCEDRQ